MTNLEVSETNETLQESLEFSIGNKLYKEGRKELIDAIGLKDKNGRLQKSISMLNLYLQHNHLPYVIISKKDKRRVLENGEINPNRDKSYWVINKTIDE